MLYPQKNFKTLNFTSYETQSLYKLSEYVQYVKAVTLNCCNADICTAVQQT